LYHSPLPVVFSNQIRSGKAQILTVVHGQEIKKYDIVIEKLLPGRLDGKNMIIRITDPKLLEETGGIVQGMSGSPIIQDGRIAGAVTHVFVNDPSRGYGVFIENMLFEAEIINKQKRILGQSSQDSFCFA
jgi:stage IV sporulation protein B